MGAEQAARLWQRNFCYHQKGASFLCHQTITLSNFNTKDPTSGKKKKKKAMNFRPKIRLWLKQAFRKGYHFESPFRLTLTSFKLYICTSLPRLQPTHNILRCQRAKSCASEQSKRNHRLEKKLWAEIIFHCCKWHRR